MDIQVSSNFERLLFDLAAVMARAGGTMAGFEASKAMQLTNASARGRRAWSPRPAPMQRHEPGDPLGLGKVR